MPLMDLLGTILSGAFGLSVVAGLMLYISYRNSYRWRYLADRYGSNANELHTKKHLQNAILYGNGGAYNSYNGILTIGIMDTGLVLRILKPFSAFHQPLFIPFMDIRGWKQLWYLNSRSVELEFTGAPDVKVLIPECQAKWISDNAQVPISLSGDLPPEDHKPKTSYAITVGISIAYLILGIVLLANFLGFRLL